MLKIGSYVSLFLLFLVFSVSACFNSVEKEPFGKLVIGSSIAGDNSSGISSRSVMATNSSTTDDIERVVITISGNHIANPIIYDLVEINSQWQGIIGDIPAGDVIVRAEAFDAGGELIYFDTENIAVVNDQVHNVHFVLEPISGSPDVSLKAPYINSVNISKDKIAPGETINLSVDAVDPDSGVLSYVWTPTDPGSYSNPSTSMTTWTAPAAEGLYDLTITVIDDDYLIDKVTFTIDVKNEYGTGTIPIVVGINNYPEVISIGADPARLAPGETTSLFIVASDPDGDSLSYLWTATCDGSFNDATSSSPQFSVASSASLGDCTMQVQVSDGSLTTQGSVLIHILNEAESNNGPEIISSFQSSVEAGPGGTVVLIIKAKDPEGNALGFTWNASIGTFSDESITTITNGYEGRVTWTAPASFGDSVVITADVTDDKGVKTTVTFLAIVPQ